MLEAPQRPLRNHAPEEPSMAYNALPRQFVDLSSGRVAYLRHGSGAPLLLVHGIPTSCRLWEPLLGTLGERYDCIVPDLLGLGRSEPLASADLSSPGQASMLAELLDRLGVSETLAVFHDQGGAHGMQFLKRYGDRVRAVVFTDIVCYDNWFVPAIGAVVTLGRWGWLPALARVGILQQGMKLFPFPQTLVRRKFPKELLDDWYYALDRGGAAMDAWVRYVVSQSNRWTLDGVPTLRAWTKPALVVWGAHDLFLPVSWAVKLARDIPGAPDDPKLLPFAGHFWQAEVPREGARVFREFFDGLEAPTPVI